MDISRLIKFSIIMFFIISCKEKRRYFYKTYNSIKLRYCDIRTTTINKAHIQIFKKGTNFDFLENQDSVFSVEKTVLSSDSTNLRDHFINIKFKHIDSLPTNKDYILIINKKYTYKISDIDTTSIRKKRGSMSSDVFHNTIESLIINGKKTEARNFCIPCNLR